MYKQRYTYFVCETALGETAYWVVLKLLNPAHKSVFTEIAYFESVRYPERIEELVTTLSRKIMDTCSIWFFKRIDIAGMRAHDLIEGFEKRDRREFLLCKVAPISPTSEKGMELFRNCNRYAREKSKESGT